MPARKLFLMRVNANQVPGYDHAVHLDLPPGIVSMLDEGWKVVSHSVRAPDLSGDRLFTHYAERD